MNLEQRVTDALDAAGRAHEGPADDLWPAIAAQAARERRRRRALLGGSAAIAAVAAGALALLLVGRPDRERVTVNPATSTTEAPTSTSSTTDTTAPATPTTVAAVTPTTSGPPAPAPRSTFVGVRDQNKLVVAEAATGKVVRTLHTHPEAYGVSSPSLSVDGTVAYFVVQPINAPNGTVYRVPVAGGPPTKVMDGCGVALSPDGNKAAVLGGPGGCRDGITVRTLSTGALKHYPRGAFEGGVSRPTWTKDSASVLFSGSGDALPPRLYRLDLDRHRTLADAVRLGPPGNPDHGWDEAELVRSTGAVKVVEYCCMADAEPSPSDTSDVLTIDPATGTVLDRWRTPQDVTALVAEPGGNGELYIGNRFELYRREGDAFRRLPGTWSAADW